MTCQFTYDREFEQIWPTRKTVQEILTEPQLISQTIFFGGWIKSRRMGGGGAFAFIHLVDGSQVTPVQIFFDSTAPGFEHVSRLATGAAIVGRGQLTVSEGKGQEVEIKVTGDSSLCKLSLWEIAPHIARDKGFIGIAIVGECDPESYPLGKQEFTKEYLRTIPHLRVRTTYQTAVSRIRSKMAFAVHLYYAERDYLWIHTPIITTLDAEGAGDLFSVFSDKELAQIEQKKSITQIEDRFFGQGVYLTCSGQLSIESYATALSKTYTFGPTFRAEESHTQKHLAEFWMIEDETAFGDLETVIDTSTSLISFCLQYVLTHCKDELAALDRLEPESPPSIRIQKLIAKKVVHMSYTDAIKQIEKFYDSPQGKEHLKTTGQTKPEFFFGIDLSSDMENILTSIIHPETPVAVKYWPKDHKAFYMRLSPDNPQTVDCVDILYPGVGEVVGGSAREINPDRLLSEIERRKMSLETYADYLELRKYGSVPHSGFGIGFDRMVKICVGGHIRDLIPYPRAHRHARG